MEILTLTSALILVVFCWIISLDYLKTRAETKRPVFHYRSSGFVGLTQIKGDKSLSQKIGNCTCSICEQNKISGILWSNPDLLVQVSYRHYLKEFYTLSSKLK